MTTGADFKKIYERKIDKSFSTYYNDAKLNELFKEALITSIERKYRDYDQQKEMDEISSVIKTEQIFTPLNNIINVTGNSLPIIGDYRHLLNLKARFDKLIPSDIIAATNASPIVIDVDSINNLRTTEKVFIENVVGNTNANGVFFIRNLNRTKFELYQDEQLTQPVIGNAPYISGGKIHRVHENYAEVNQPDQKAGSYGNPKEDTPKYEMTQNQIKIHPLNAVCKQITVDYVTTITVFIDVNDAVIDLEVTYPFKFLTFVASVATGLFMEEQMNQEGAQYAKMETRTNN